ncbi:MAG TPA: CaiB/BaiF CoA-transferase family protein [Chryseolinea sp.]|nr:CaiB/BaiF CoA-transferase family protein [Chryseolinea sp.]HPM31186.1 CaiB/BaiF CoA-transferase family protein [Chryseolinea sp.]
MLHNIKVIELASVLAGPSVGQFFAELGADVIKIENLKTRGDVTRSWKGSGEQTDERSAYFCSVNWGKRSLAVDLTKKEGREIIHKLVTQADIVIASYKPGDAEKLEMDYNSLSKLNPKLIYGQITGYGSDNPRVGYDAIIQAEAGFMQMNGEQGGASLKMPVALIDVLAGHHLKEGVLLAMIQLVKTGKGSFVEVSLIQAAISSLVNQATNWLIAGKLPQKKGSAHPNIAPYGDVFITEDGQEVLLAVGSDRQFIDLCQLLEVGEIVLDSKFSTNQSRVDNRKELNQIIQKQIGRLLADTIIVDLNKAKIPAGRIQSLKQVFEMHEAKELLIRSSDRIGVKSYVASTGFTLNQENIPHISPPPKFGEHTNQILSTHLQLSPEAMKNLSDNGIII